MEQIKIDVVKQWLINKKEFTPLEVIEELEKENAELKKEIEMLNKRNIAVQKAIFDCGL